MRKFNWERLKLRAQCQFTEMHAVYNSWPGHALFLALAHAAYDKDFTPGLAKKFCEEWIAYGNKLIENWDIRLCMKLVECFPGILPEHLRNRVPVCGYDEKGEWALFFE